MIRNVVPDAQTTLISRNTNSCGGHLACVHQRNHKVNADKNQIIYLKKTLTHEQSGNIHLCAFVKYVLNQI